jgi:hypothetical protein
MCDIKIEDEILSTAPPMLAAIVTQRIKRVLVALTTIQS